MKSPSADGRSLL